MKKFLVIGLVLLGVLVLIAINPFTTVDAGERGVVLRDTVRFWVPINLILMLHTAKI